MKQLKQNRQKWPLNHQQQKAKIQEAKDWEKSEEKKPLFIFQITNVNITRNEIITNQFSMKYFFSNKNFNQKI